MSLVFKRGNLLDEDAKALVNCVNCIGVAGKGIAIAFKQRFPANHRYYHKHCLDGFVLPGQVLVFQGTPQAIFNAATKDHWRDPSRIEWIRECLDEIRAAVRFRKIESIALPALGCGNGGLLWCDVKPLIVAAMEPLTEVDVRVYEPEDRR